MNNQTVLRSLFSAVFAVAVLCFFGMAYPHHLHFQEQYQLFMFDAGYAADVLAVPGGLADYLGRFFTQFFLYAWVGASVIAVLLCLVQIVMYGTVCRVVAAASVSKGSTGPSEYAYALSFAPSFLLWRLMCDENVLLGTVVALLLGLLLAYVLIGVRRQSCRRILMLLSVPVAYWAMGGVSLMFVVLVVLAEFCRERSLSVAGFAAALLLVLAAMPQLAYKWVNYPLEQLYFGVHYYRYSDAQPMILWMAVAVICLLPLVALLLPHPQPKHRVLSAGSSWGAMMLLGAALIYQAYQPAREELMQYDFWSRTEQWNRIINQSKVKAPNTQVSVSALNLALGKKGMMADHLFDYIQNGTQGLLAPFQRDPVSPLVTGEAFYQLGMINTAQCFFFEAQEAIPDFQKSVRCYRRLAECNIINGNYRVAGKYLRALQKTLFYKDWANDAASLLYDEEAVNRHPVYGVLRHSRIDGDFFFSDRELPQMLGQLYMSNTSNRMAFDYLESAYLLQGDIDGFAQCYSLGDQHYPMQIPQVYQQALLLWWSRDHAATDPMPSQFRQDMVQQMHQFYALVQQKASADVIAQRYGNTYWYYYFFLR